MSSVNVLASEISRLGCGAISEDEAIALANQEAHLIDRYEEIGGGLTEWAEEVVKDELGWRAAIDEFLPLDEVD